MAEITLKIQDQVFNVNKETLCEYSDYFRAMFSGNYAENEQQVISIDVLDPNIMNIIVQYMQIGLIDLSELDLPTIGDIAIAANFLQITELLKQIEYTLDSQTCESNFMETMAIAETSTFRKLEQYSAAYGLYAFRSMKPEYIPTIHKLAWYLSHPYLDCQSELDVFKFGFQWVLKNETGADAILIILGCLDMKTMSSNDFEEMKVLMKDFENSLAAKVIECICELLKMEQEISLEVLDMHKLDVLEKFNERVLTEIKNIVKESKTRLLKYTPLIPMWLLKDSKPELLPHCMYTYTKDNGFEKWLEVAEKNLWGWNVVAWGLTKLVIVCGEYGRGTGTFMKDVKVYDVLRKEWTRHGVDLPPRRHSGVAVVGDSLYIVGGVGGFRVVMDTVIMYDLKQRSYRKIAKLPDAIQNPAVCSHENRVYAAGQKNIYRYEDLGSTDTWKNIVGTEIRMSCLRSFKQYIYCMQGYFSHLYRFRPDFDQRLELITYFSNLPATMCNLGDSLIVFTRTVCGQCDILAVEEYRGQSKAEKPRVLATLSKTSMRVNDVAGSCALVMTVPPLKSPLSQYQERYLTRYIEPV
ncbi:kelch-like protein 25 [Danaus plexippus]|uniref:kelch-like protein 25 n=1 Tax=Danaus plexippus TaxID=13037 RepID=UPI002AB22E51|nr:kelch-like protein 25 [Danaus plexippus]